MQTLKLANDLFPGLRDGSKRITIRTGRRDIVLGLLAFEPVNEDDGPPHVVNVTSVRYTLMHYITDAEAQADGAADWRSLLTAMHRFYPDITETSVVTVIEFTP